MKSWVMVFGMVLSSAIMQARDPFFFPATGAAAGLLQPYKVVAIAHAEGKTSAVLARDNERHVVSQGDCVAQYRVQQVSESSVILVNEAETIELFVE